MNQDQDLKSIDWLREYLSAQIGSGQVKSDDPEALMWRTGLAPFGDAIFSVPGNMFLSDGRKPRGPVVWIRDGLIPLLHFFQEQSPEVFETKLLIHSRYRKIVPARWASRVMFYRLKHVGPEIYSKPKKVIIVGCQSPAMGSLQETDRVLRAIGRQWGLGPDSQIEIQVWLPVKSPHFLGYPKIIENGVERIFRSLALLGRGVEFMDWSDFALAQDMSDAHFCEINTGNLIQESHCSQLLMARGARRVEIIHENDRIQLSSGIDQTVRPGAEFIQLSPYHGLEVQVGIESGSQDLVTMSEKRVEELARLEEVLNWDNSMIKRAKKNISTMGQTKPTSGLMGRPR
jgi:hypothetical protein